jgi:hypothetical protein
MYISRRFLPGQGFIGKTELFDHAIGAAIKKSVATGAPVLILEEDDHHQPGVYVEKESEVRRHRDRRRVYARVEGWKIEWVS